MIFFFLLFVGKGELLIINLYNRKSKEINTFNVFQYITSFKTPQQHTHYNWQKGLKIKKILIFLLSKKYDCFLKQLSFPWTKEGSNDVASEESQRCYWDTKKHEVSKQERLLSCSIWQAPISLIASDGIQNKIFHLNCIGFCASFLTTFHLLLSLLLYILNLLNCLSSDHSVLFATS